MNARLNADRSDEGLTAGGIIANSDAQDRLFASVREEIRATRPPHSPIVLADASGRTFRARCSCGWLSRGFRTAWADPIPVAQIEELKRNATLAGRRHVQSKRDREEVAEAAE